jgi:predicted transcriptional regulator
MSISTTSINAYTDIKNDGTTATQKNIILDTLDTIAKPLSAREVSQITGIEINAISGRINELKTDGLLVEAEKRKCSISHRTIRPVTSLNNMFRFNTRFFGRPFWKTPVDEAHR